MPLVECTLGAATTPIMGWTYVFERDRFDRYVAKVENKEHVRILTSVYCYRVVTDEPEVVAAAPALAPKPKKAAPPAPVEPVAPAPKLPQAAEPTTEPAAEPPVEPVALAPDGLASDPDAVPGLDTPAPDPLDHDGDGKKGGSKPQAKPPAVTDIKGIGAKLAEKLAECGIDTVQQIATMNEQDAAATDELLGLNGRITREKWVEQAAALLAW